MKVTCKLCKSVIERGDCECGEIGIRGSGTSERLVARDFGNALIHGKDDLIPLTDNNSDRPSYEDLLAMLNQMIKGYETLPNSAFVSPVSNIDIASALILISAIFRSLKERS